MRSAARLFVGALAILGVTFGGGDARADDDGHRFGLAPLVGGGIAGLVHPGALPGFIGFTDLGVEILGEYRPWGGFLRAEFLSSGDGGRWTDWAFSAGAEYRLFGDPRRTAAFLRGGLAFDHWSGNTEGCEVDYFVPNSCVLEGSAARSTFSATADMLGVIAGARVEMPVPWMYLAFSANFVPVVAVDSSNPAAAFSLRFDMEIAFRDVRTSDDQTRVKNRGGGRGRGRGRMQPAEPVETNQPPPEEPAR